VHVRRAYKQIEDDKLPVFTTFDVIFGISVPDSAKRVISYMLSKNSENRSFCVTVRAALTVQK
jgi:hypothetical protein